MILTTVMIVCNNLRWSHKQDLWFAAFHNKMDFETFDEANIVQHWFDNMYQLVGRLNSFVM